MKYYLLIPLLPLAAFLINILLGKEAIREKAHWPSILAVLGSWLVTIFWVLPRVVAGNVINEDFYTWIVSGTFHVTFGFLLDPLTAVMLFVVTTCATLIHIYAVGYMRGDTGYYRFFAYMSLFTFFMLMLVMGNNFLQLYLGWEGVGLCSYFLIGFYFNKKSAADAGKKAFIVNRFGDFGFGIGVFMIFLTFGTLHYAPVFAHAADMAGKTVNFLGWNVDLPTLIALLLFCGAVGKSAQIPLHVWLPDAMEGPTPVSALIHAATMVTAGVFMVARCNAIFNLSAVAMNVVAIIGALTMFFAATVAITQNDIKRIIAYSTCSHLGYMFLACGVGAYSAGIFHLYTHAFFKALLFLAAGSVIHSVHTNDIREMGGLKKYMPITYAVFVVAGLSAGGFPGLGGFFSKDEIIWSAYASGVSVGKFVWLLGMAGAFLTPFYTFRLIFVAFHGKYRGAHGDHGAYDAGHGGHHIHESPWVMTIPLMLLGVGAIAAGWIGIPSILGGGAHFSEFLRPVVGEMESHASHAEEWRVMGTSTLLVFIGLGLSAFFYMRESKIPELIARAFKPIYQIVYNKYYVDELYHYTIIKPTMWIAKNILVAFTDARIIEGVVNGVPGAIGWFSGKLRKAQTGLAQHYGIMMAAGAFFIVALVLLFR